MSFDPMDHIVVDWRESLPAEGLWLIEGITVEQFKALQAAHPDWSVAELMGALKAGGHEIVYVAARAQAT